MRKDPLDEIIVRRRGPRSLPFALLKGFCAAVVLTVALPVSASSAQTSTTTPAPLKSCPQQGLSLSRVEVTSPKDGATVPAGAQTVSGRVGAGFTRLELFVDGRLSGSDDVDPAGGNFALSWQASAVVTRSVELLVVACGGGIAQLVRATNELTVTVTPAPTTTTRAGSSTTVGTPSPTAVQATTSTAPGSTTVAAGGSAATTTTVSSGTTAPARVPEPAAAGVARVTTTTRARPQTPPLVLSEEAGDDSPGPPLWVGAVVGLGGTIGLVLSSVLSRRSAARAARSELPPVDPSDERSDLVSL